MEKSKRKKKLRMILMIVGSLFLIEVFALIWLVTSIGHFKKYWLEAAKRPGEITYLALGDSAAQGIGATSPARGYVGIVASRLEKKTGKKIQTINVSKSGAKMEDYLREQASSARSIPADVVTIEIGANDMVQFNAKTFRSSFRKVLASLPDGAFVSNMPLFNSRPGRTSAGKEASTIIEEELAHYPKLHFVDLQKQTTEHASIFGFAPDLFHPNNLSYKNWADAFWAQIDSQPI